MIVVKTGGDLIGEGLSRGLVEELKVISEGEGLIVVHGGGDMVTETATRLGHPPRFVVSPKGFRSRYTDKETSLIYTMVMAGKINKGIVSSLQASGVPAVGLSGLDGALVRARRKKRIIAVDERGRRVLMEGGYTGKIEEVDAEFLRLLIGNGYVPVVSSIAMGEEAEPLNVDGDRMAASIASALRAERLVLLTDVEGLRLDGRTIDGLTSAEAKESLAEIGPGMVTKVYAAIEALEGGVGEVLIASGFKERAIGSALEHENGTVIRK